MTFKKLLSPVALACAAVMMLASCGKNSSVSDKVKEYLPDDCLMAMSGDIQRVLTTMECKTNSDGQIELSDELAAYVSQLYGHEQLEKFLEFKGVDWNNVVVGIRGKGEKVSALVVFSVTDKDTFAKSLQDAYEEADEDLDFEIEEEGDYTILGEKYGAFAVKGNMGFLAIKDGRPVKRSKVVDTIDEWREKAAEEPMAGWKADYLAKERIFNMLIDGKKLGNMMSDMYYGMSMPGMDFITKGYMGVYFDVDGLTATFSGEFLDSEGNAKGMPEAGTFDSSLLSYASPKDFVAAGMGIGKTSGLAQNLASLPGMNQEILGQMQAIYDMFDGASIMGAAGPTAGALSFKMPSNDNWHYVVAAKFKNGNAAKAMEMLQSIVPAANDSAAVTGDEMVLNIPVGYDYPESYYETDFYSEEYVEPTPVYAKLYVKRDGDVLVVSNAPIARQSNGFKPGDFSGKAFELQFAMTKDDIKAASGLVMPFGFSFVMDAPKGGGTCSAVLALTETKGSIYSNIVEFLGSNKKD